MSPTPLFAYCFLSVCCLFIPTFQMAQSPVEVKEINGYEYEIIPGLAEITAIQLHKKAHDSPLKYDEYEVRFRFIPKVKHPLLKIIEQKPTNLQLRYRTSTVLVGPEYVRKMNIKIGRKYAIQLYQAKSRGVNIERFFFQSKALEMDLFKAYENIIDGLSLIYNFAKDSSINKNYTLSEVEQRAWNDAKLKIPKEKLQPNVLPPAVLEYLSKHKALLLEYEAALTVLSKIEADKSRLKHSQENDENRIFVGPAPAYPSVIRKTKIIYGCYYEVLPGLAEVVAVNLQKKAIDSKWSYDEYEVLFKFNPMEGHQLIEVFQDTALPFFLYHRGEKIPVGPAYLQKKNVRVGTRYSMVFYQKKDKEACTERYTYTSKGLDNDLFEALPPPTYFQNIPSPTDSFPHAETVPVEAFEPLKPPIRSTSMDSLQRSYDHYKNLIEDSKVQQKQLRASIKAAKRGAARVRQRQKQLERDKNKQ